MNKKKMVAIALTKDQMVNVLAASAGTGRILQKALTEHPPPESLEPVSKDFLEFLSELCEQLDSCLKEFEGEK